LMIRHRYGDLSRRNNLKNKKHIMYGLEGSAKVCSSLTTLYFWN
ncbi:hypothetical protein T4B_10343, partial [Trichinella pseudospiralis]